MDELTRVLTTAYAPIPGLNHHTRSVRDLTRAVDAEIDIVSMKLDSLPHIQHFGQARLMRVPLPDGPDESRESFLRALKRQLETPYDVVHCRSPHEVNTVAEHIDPNDTHLIYEMASYAEDLGCEYAEFRHAHEEALKRAKSVIVPGSSAERALRAGGFESEITVLGPSIDIGGFDPWRKPDRATVRLLYLGPLTEARDCLTLMDAIRNVSKETKLEVLLAGDPLTKRREEAFVQAGELGVSDIVVIKGEPRAAALRNVISAADICVVTAGRSARYGEYGDLPYPLLDHLACARPTVVAGVPGVADIVSDESEALFYLPGDADTLARAILRLTNEPEFAEQLAIRGQAKAKELQSTFARQTLAGLYEQITSQVETDAWERAFEDGDDVRDSAILPSADTGVFAARGEDEETGSRSRDNKTTLQMDLSETADGDSGKKRSQDDKTDPAAKVDMRATARFNRVDLELQELDEDDIEESTNPEVEAALVLQSESIIVDDLDAMVEEARVAHSTSRLPPAELTDDSVEELDLDRGDVVEGKIELEELEAEDLEPSEVTGPKIKAPE